ncbi:unnamed protein product [Phytomonas sp. Hart1]|nr:unnamed protein product [Phytomonas sp. Hart1]|eukprot:CCW70025.1 unnamed protein product [Phytomonas sp. isolate Hart1]
MKIFQVTLKSKNKQLKERDNFVGASFFFNITDIPQMDSTTGRKRRVSRHISELSNNDAEDREQVYSIDSNGSNLEYHDDYGFRITAREKLAESNYKRLHTPSYHFTHRWMDILSDWDQVPLKKKKKYCRMGSPQDIRGKVWQLLLGTFNIQNTPGKWGVYIRLKSKPLANNISDVIERDLGRTFPTQIMFEDGTKNNGRDILRNILHAYANYNTQVGYCQGMNFLVATLLLQISDEESTFWAFCALMDNQLYQMKSLYEPGFPQLHCCFYVLCKLLKLQNKKVYKRMKELNIEGVHFATHWFLSIFTYQFNFRLISRIWDMFLCEGWKPIYRIALALLSMEKEQLLAQHSDSDMLMVLSTIQEGKDPDELLKNALSVKFRTKKVHKYIKKFQNR